VGKSFPHPVGVFCTHLEPPRYHVSTKVLGQGKIVIDRAKGYIEAPKRLFCSARIMEGMP
jgi:hypothetical protein